MVFLAKEIQSGEGSAQARYTRLAKVAAVKSRHRRSALYDRASMSVGGGEGQWKDATYPILTSIRLEVVGAHTASDGQVT